MPQFCRYTAQLALAADAVPLAAASEVRYCSACGSAPLKRRLCAEILNGDFMPQKVRELVAELERAGFVNRGGKGSHRNFVHPKVSKPITISGSLGDDAKHYQVRAVNNAVKESQS